MIAASEVKNQLSRESMWFQFFFFAVQLIFPLGIFYSFKNKCNTRMLQINVYTSDSFVRAFCPYAFFNSMNSNF